MLSCRDGRQQVDERDLSEGGGGGTHHGIKVDDDVVLVGDARVGPARRVDKDLAACEHDLAVELAVLVLGGDVVDDDARVALCAPAGAQSSGAVVDAENGVG